jgi:hypothetical protein
VYRAIEDDYTFWPIDDDISRRLALDPAFASPFVRTALFPELAPAAKPMPVVEPTPYKVGNKCPPKEHQFKKGQSGNKKGRPKRRPSLHALLTEELQRTVTVTMNGKSVKMTNYQLLAQQLVSSVVVKKDWAALKILDGMLQESYAADQKTAQDDYWAAAKAEVDDLVWTDEMDEEFREVFKDDEDFIRDERAEQERRAKAPKKPN